MNWSLRHCGRDRDARGEVGCEVPAYTLHTDEANMFLRDLAKKHANIWMEDSKFPSRSSRSLNTVWNFSVL